MSDVISAKIWGELLNQSFMIEIDEARYSFLSTSIFAFCASKGLCPDELLVRAQNLKLTESEWAYLLHLATNHETTFFRYPATTEFIADHVSCIQSPKIVSVGCSTGEEAYSIATALLRRGRASFQILGTDISEICIDTARLGTYKANPHLSQDVVAPARDGRVVFHSWIKDKVRFQQHNVMGTDPFEIENPDVIVTQNMLIYYKPKTRHAILGRLASALPKGGILITGLTEDAGYTNPNLIQVVSQYLNAYLKV